MNPISRTTAQVVVAVVVAVFAIGILTSGGQVDSEWLRFYSLAVTVLLVIGGLWDRVLWKIEVIQKVKGVPRDLNGTWRGRLTSFWEDPSTGESPPPKDAYLVVRQTASHLSATLITDESMSRSSLADVSTDDGHAALTYTYLNKPDNRVEHRSRIHHGSASLHITGRPATRLRGRYWTDRDSRGELDLGERVGARAEDFDSAVALFDKSR